ncbi:hypothetical protein Tco_0934740 [Tanacetum coccineum]
MAQENQQQIRSDEALVPKDNQVKIGDCNFRIAPEKKQKEPTYQLTLDILKQYSCYNAFLKTVDVPQIYMHQFWYTVAKNTRTQTYHFMLDDQQFEVGAELLREALQITPKVPKNLLIHLHMTNLAASTLFLMLPRQDTCRFNA